MTLQLDFERLRLARKAVCAELLSDRTSKGHWLGEISGSPLATAVAVSALVLAHDSDAGIALIDVPENENSINGEAVLEQIVQSDLSELIVHSLHWLAQNQNDDGGWADATRGKSNIAATLAVQAAFRLTGVPAKYADLMDLADEYVDREGGIASLRGDSGNDKVLAAPILANCALAGMVPWRQVPTLPFELVCLPQPWADRLRLPLDRLEIPCLVAIGQAKLHHDRPRNPLNRMLRNAMRAGSLTIVAEMQAADGSFLGGIPSTAMVIMNLASIGQQRHPIVERGVEFLLSTMRNDGSWPIVANLAVTNTTLAINELSASAIEDPRPIESPRRNGVIWRPSTHLDDTMIDSSIHNDTVIDFHAHPAISHAAAPNSPLSHEDAHEERDLFNPACLTWLLDSQKQNSDPATGATSGGWGWSDTTGAAPNTSDTASTLRSLANWLGRATLTDDQRIASAIHAGEAWLLAAQNRDGGWPMWQEERSESNPSSPDLTAGALRALVAFQRALQSTRFVWGARDKIAELQKLMSGAIDGGLNYLAKSQRADGSFVAAQFASNHHVDSENPTLGTALVLQAIADCNQLDSATATRAVQWLLSAQHSGGGWGPPRAPLDYSGAYKNGAYAWRENDVLAKHCSVEETSKAISALLPLATGNPTIQQAMVEGLSWLADAVEQDEQHRPAVVGFSNAKLWYHERLYPLAFAAGALSRAILQLAPLRPATTSVG